MTDCFRCGKPFDEQEVRFAMKLKSLREIRFCEMCMFRNLTDGLGLPTHPDMLDRYSKHPTLTEEEYRKKLKE